MKIYALIAVASACLLITSCTTDDLEQTQKSNPYNNNIEGYMMKDSDTTFVNTSVIDGEPVKTNGRD